MLFLLFRCLLVALRPASHTTRHALFAPSELIVVTVVTYSAKFSRCFVQARHLKILQNACLVVCTQKCPFAAAYRLLQKDESTLSYFFVVPPFFPESSHLQAQQDTKANALISLCGNGHNTVQTYLLLFFQSETRGRKFLTNPSSSDTISS